MLTNKPRLTKERLERLLAVPTAKELAKRIAAKKWRRVGKPVKFSACEVLTP